MTKDFIEEDNRVKVKTLIEITKEYKKIYIQPHNIPDPDAIATSFALYELLKIYGVEAEIIYVNHVEKSNSKQMMELFDIPMKVRSEKNLIAEDSL